METGYSISPAETPLMKGEHCFIAKLPIRRWSEAFIPLRPVMKFVASVLPLKAPGNVHLALLVLGNTL